MSRPPAWAWHTEFFFRSLLGFVAGPILGGALCGVLTGVVVVLFSLVRGDLIPASIPEIIVLNALVCGGFGARYGVLAALIVGWPVHAWLVRSRHTSVWTYVGFGLVAFGVLPVLGANFETWWNGEPELVTFDVLSALICFGGAIGGFIFWLIRRPDCDRIDLEPAP